MVQQELIKRLRDAASLLQVEIAEKIDSDRARIRSNQEKSIPSFAKFNLQTGMQSINV